MQWNNGSAYVRLGLALLATAGSVVLAGCSVKASTPPTNYTNKVVLQGQVFAGRNYMPGATVKIYETQPSGTWSASAGAYVGTAKLLSTVTANTTGGWSVTGLSCSSPDQLYVTAEGGTPYPSGQNSTTLAANPNSLMMTAIGDCSVLTAGGSTSPDNVTSIVVNEASTVAAVWALRNFISLNGTTVNVTSDASNYAGSGGAGVVGNYAGLVHAFLNANNLSPYKLGAFQQYTQGAVDATTGGLVPVQELNSLAYAQYLCTMGGDGTKAGDFTYCQTLYGLATPPGGTAPTNSLAAMLNIARYPANNADAILAFTLTPIPGTTQTSSQQINAGVYVPYLTAFGTLTDDWSVAIFYGPGYGGNAGAQASVVPMFVTLDANDNVYFANPATSSSSAQGNVVALTSSGVDIWNSPNDGTVGQPRAIAADQSGNIWTVQGNNAGVVKQMRASDGSTVALYNSTASTLYGVAVDSLGNVWYSSATTTGQNLHELVKNGSTYTEATFAIPPSSTTYQLYQIRPDANNNIWVAGYSSSKGAAVYFPNTGTAAAPTYTAGLQYGLITGTGTYGVTTDASGAGWATTSGTGNGVWKVAVTGSGASATLAPTNVAADPAAGARFMDIDGSGAIWYVDNTTGTKVYQYIPGHTATTAFYPCYNAGTTTGTGTATSVVQTCTTGISTRLDLAVDSTGSIWVASYGNSGGGRMAQIIGLAAPTVPLKAAGKPGVIP